MPRVDLVLESPVPTTPRVRQLEATFDIPKAAREVREWHGDVDLPDAWSVGLIVGPSGCGKSSLARTLFPDEMARTLDWSAGSVLDDFADGLSMEQIAAACQAVGFNTIPAWRRPYHVLSTGERFRVSLARQLLEWDDPVVVDEFTSVVDRQVAKIGSHAAQKYARRNARRFVAVTCHYDVLEWLQPDWVLEPATMAVTRRSVQCGPRGDAKHPDLQVTIGRVPYAAWKLFAPFHYLTASLHSSARCFGLWVGDRLASFAAVLPMPHPKTKNIRRLSRGVTLPDWQGLGLEPYLTTQLGAAYQAAGYRLRSYPAHPAFIRTRDRSPDWALKKKPGRFSPRDGDTSTIAGKMSKSRPCAVFEYVGPAMSKGDAAAILGDAVPLGVWR